MNFSWLLILKGSVLDCMFIWENLKSLSNCSFLPTSPVLILHKVITPLQFRTKGRWGKIRAPCVQGDLHCVPQGVFDKNRK